VLSSYLYSRKLINISSTKYYLPTDFEGNRREPIPSGVQYSWHTRPDGEKGAILASTEDLVLGFANTHGHLGRLPERFVDSAGLRDWLSQQQQLDSKALVITAADVIEAREIRDALVTVMVSHADAEAASADELLVAEQALQRAAQRYPLQANITRQGAGLSSVQPGLAGVIGSVLASVIELAQSGQWNRFKACRNCHHSFVDQSRNASATFCRTSCKSQAGMRAYRSRQRGSAEQ
jgi:predicted RNA-binding Zn ribbon-like protein